MLSLYNSLTNQKEIFKSIKPREVRLYVCGMTVYDLCHLGHARVMVVFDVINRWLKISGYKVQYVRNITDIDDKIIAKAAEENITINELTERFILEMNKDADALGVLQPDSEPRATNHIRDIINMIQILIDKGFAYVGENNDVYYSVSEFSGYGKLSGKTLKDLRAGDRVDIDSYKKNDFDFVMCFNNVYRYNFCYFYINRIQLVNVPTRFFVNLIPMETVSWMRMSSSKAVWMTVTS